MLRLFVLYILVTLGINLSISGEQKKPAMISFDQTHHQQDVSISRTDTFTIVLPVLMGTGYSWQWEEQQAFKLIDRKLKQTNQQLGTREEQVFLIRPLQKGKHKLRLAYRRPWEKQVNKTYELTVEVSE